MDNQNPDKKAMMSKFNKKTHLRSLTSHKAPDGTDTSNVSQNNQSN